MKLAMLAASFYNTGAGICPVPMMLNKPYSSVFLEDALMEQPKQPALYWEKLDDGRVLCQLCPHACRLADGQKGICQVRRAGGGKLYPIYYGMVAAGGQIDPIEKKPLYNFRPGTQVLSFGSVGCNLKCDHCQNCSLSQEFSTRYLSPITAEQIVTMAQKSGCHGVGWTYNEPGIHFETYYHWSQVIRQHGLYLVWISNGYLNAQPLRQMAPYLDAVNIDVKAFSEEFYRKYTKSRLQPVLETCVLARELQLHIELTYLIIPTLNDSKQEIGKYLDWAGANLGYEVPLHFFPVSS